MDLLDLIDEAENGPLPCRHNVTMTNGGWVQELDPKSDFYAEWVHGRADCRRSRFPGHKQPLPEMKWSAKKQKDVPV